MFNSSDPESVLINGNAALTHERAASKQSSVIPRKLPSPQKPSDPRSTVTLYPPRWTEQKNPLLTGGTQASTDVNYCHRPVNVWSTRVYLVPLLLCVCMCVCLHVSFRLTSVIWCEPQQNTEQANLKRNKTQRCEAFSGQCTSVAAASQRLIPHAHLSANK